MPQTGARRRPRRSVVRGRSGRQWGLVSLVLCALVAALVGGCSGRRVSSTPAPLPAEGIPASRPAPDTATAVGSPRGSPGEGKARRAPERVSAAGEAALQQGVASLNQGRLPEAQEAFERAVRSDPQSPLVHDYLGISHLQQRHYDAALREFREEQRLGADSAMGWAREADVHQARRDLKQAITALQKAIQREPDLAQLHFNLGVLDAQYLQLAAAVASLRRCVELEPGSAYSHFVLARLLLQTAQLDEAQRELERAIALQPGAGDYHFTLGQLLLRRRATPEASARALAELDRALALGVPQPGQVRYYRGLCLQRQGKWQESVDALRTATRLEPDLPGAYHALAASYERLGQPAEARAALAHFEELHAAAESRKLGSFYTEEVARNRDDPDTYYQLGGYLEAHGDVVGGATALKRAAELAAEQHQPAARQRRIHQRLEALYERQGLRPEAEAERARIRRLERSDAG